MVGVRRYSWGLLAFVGSMLGGIACSDEATIVPPAGSGGDTPAPPPEDTSGAPAILLATAVQAPDNINTYVGAFPELPTGELDYSLLREFGNANIYTASGYVFVEEAGVVTRFSVDADYRLVEGPRMSWASYGLAEANQSYVVFGSPTRAYTFAPPLGRVVVWNPETMAITSTLPLDLPTPPDGFETYAYEGVRAGDKVVWSVITANWETYEMNPGVLLAVTDANQDGPITFLQDDRCLGGGSSVVDESGNLYVHAGGNLGIFAAYSTDPNVRTCMLRMNAGEATLAQDFMADYRDLTGSYVSYPWVHVAGNQYLVRRWDPEVPFPEDPGEYWDNAALQPFIVDTASREMRPYPDVAGSIFISGIQYVIDGESYMEVSSTGAVEGGTADLVKLTPDGTVQQLHMSGSMAALARIR